MLRFVIAIQPEARPLIERYRLERRPEHSAFKVFRRDDVGLVVSGSGKAAAAAATAYLHLATGGVRQAAWLNVGIAGHGSREAGEAVVAHKIVDRASGQCWYPPQAFAPRLPTDQVTTVDAVERRFEDDGAFEMEASGFYPTACRFSTAELVQCLKVVSDGPGDVPENLSAREAERLVGDRLEAVEWLAGETLRVSDEARRLDEDPPELGAMLERWHFTVTEARQLRRLLERWRTLAAGRPLPADELGDLRRGRDVVLWLRERLDALPVEMG